MSARRVAALYAGSVAAAITLALLTVAVYFFAVVHGDVDRVLNMQRAAIRDAVAYATASGRPLASFAPHLASILHDQEYELTVYDDSGNVLASTLRQHPSSFDLSGSSFGIRNYLSFPVRGGYVLVAASDALVWDRFRRLFVLWLVLLALVCPAMYVVALRMSTPLLAALDTMTARFRDAARGKVEPAEGTIPRAPALRSLLEGFNEASAALTRQAVERERLENRMRAFTAEAGHELKTPIAVIVGYIGILRRGALRDPDEASRILETMAAEGKRLQVMVRNLLHLARMDARRVDEMELEFVDVGRLLCAAAEVVEPLAGGRTITIACADHLRVRCDPDDLHEAVVNVLDNALVYGAPSGITVVVDDRDDEIEIAIADEGPGMTDFEREHAFERFFRGGRRGDVEGSGLGLAIAQDVVKNSGGRVAIDSTLGKGTTVRLCLPAAAIHK